jgi:hypothetical protein
MSESEVFLAIIKKWCGRRVTFALLVLWDADQSDAKSPGCAHQRSVAVRGVHTAILMTSLPLA